VVDESKAQRDRRGSPKPPISDHKRFAPTDPGSNTRNQESRGRMRRGLSTLSFE